MTKNFTPAAVLALLTAAVSAPAAHLTALLDLLDWADAKIAAYCAAKGYGVAPLYREESLRIADGRLDWAAYRKVRRYGSHFRLDRATRLAVWAKFTAESLVWAAKLHPTSKQTLA